MFIASDISRELRRILRGMQEDLQREINDVDIPWTRIEDIHITLKFLGAVASTRVHPIGECMTEMVEGWSSLQLEVGEMGVFPSIKGPTVM